MAVTLFRKRKVINNIIIRNGTVKKEEDKIIFQPDEQGNNTQKPIRNSTPKEINTRIRGKIYGRRTINR